MSLNWKETEKLLSELPLEGSYIQKITEHSVNSYTFSMFSKTEKAWLLYVEVSSPYSRFCRTGIVKAKSKTMQRFTQYMNAHITGRKVTGVHQYPFDRAFYLSLTSSENTIRMHVRLFSGPGANIIITDEENKILELLYRRPQRNEEKGEILELEERKDEGPRHFEIRPYDTPTFNEFIDRSESLVSSEKQRSDLSLKLEEKRDKEIQALRDRLSREEKRKQETSGFDEIRRTADILSASIWAVKKGMDSIDLDDWNKGGKITISLDPALSPNENLEKLYSRYRKDKKASEAADEEIARLSEEIEATEEKYRVLLESASLEKLKKAAEKPQTGKKDDDKKPGVWVTIQGFDVAIGRNAKENDAILRHYARGSDIWLHTRDFSGGYVIIKAKKGKSVPLPVLLDAASLAIHYSKAKKSGKADLYYTEVKYLRRAKDGKTGLVLPTQERNLSVTLDERRVKEILR